MVRRVIEFRLALVPFVGGMASGACTSFAAVRSAEVHPGPAFLVQASVTTPPGDQAAWFWTLDCATGCDHVISSGDLGFGWGFARSTGGAAYALTAGVSGVYPYVDGYVQFGRSAERPSGMGARIGIPLSGWNEYAVYGRLDRHVRNGRRVVLNPTLFLHTGNSPNGQNQGSLFALVQSVGFLSDQDYGSFCPAISVIVGRGRRDGASFSVFSLMASVTLSFHSVQASRR